VQVKGNQYSSLCWLAVSFTVLLIFWVLSLTTVKKGKVHPCTGTEALYRPYGLKGEGVDV